MISVRQIAARQLFSRNVYNLGFGSKRKATPSDLDKYDVVVVGAGLGNVLATHLDAVVGEKAKIYVAYDNPVTSFHSERNLYETGNITKFNFGTPTRQTLSKNNAQSDYVGVEKINPSKNEVTLRNGRVIKYENLVIAIGQKENYQEIKGFDDAWADTVHPFYTNQDHLSWKTTVSKSYRVHLNYNGGNAYFYIPPSCYGESDHFNFFISKSIWDLHAKTGKFSWDNSKLTIINPNKTFSKHFPKLDEFIKNACYERNIAIENDLTLVEVRKSDNTAIFRHKSGQLVERPYGYFYSLLPTTTHALLAESGLADSTGYLDVNPHTLQHKKYDNIFGLGDVINAPTTKSFYGGVAQVAVVRHNVERKLNGLSLNANYDGYSKISVFTSPSSVATVEHKYEGKEESFSTDGFTASLKYKLYSMTGKHNH